ncbi:hypothetical protein [Cryobacterium sp. PH31-L1]|uniref:hypothetical protein n=1 Tax=Cryobacterium sp. PH31-L1 TaxID=3046199 RepID=UPI0024BA8073|nr:hypothetical protein [Cryobacterium sp. PH31-L1]MDJ0378338.1 hypothetical protein [Cryobacterium sp. PH31-L1]
MILLINVVLAVTPTPDPDFDPTTVTPGVIGFVAFFFVAAATVLLCLDVVRRIRRTTYRAQIKERLEAEIAERDADSTSPSTSGDKPE